MINTNTIGSITELYIGGGDSWITQSHPTNFHGFWKRRMLTGTEKPEDFKEVTDTEKTALETTDAQWERPPQEFIDRWNQRCRMFVSAGIGEFNENTGYFELNGLKDITYKQAIFCDLFSDAWDQYIENKISSSWSTWRYNVRSTFPKVGVMQQAHINTYNTDIEVVKLHASVYNDVDVITFRISALSNIKRFDDVISLKHCTDFVCESQTLEHLMLSVYNSDISLAKCPLLDFESINAIPSRATNSMPITVTVHADVMAKLNDETNTEWHQILTDAAAKQITFATLT